MSGDASRSGVVGGRRQGTRWLLWLAAVVTYIAASRALLWDDLPLGGVGGPLAFAAVGVAWGWVLGWPAAVLSLLWCVPVFLFSGEWEEGDQAVSVFFGLLIGAGALVLGAGLRDLKRRFA